MNRNEIMTVEIPDLEGTSVTIENMPSSNAIVKMHHNGLGTKKQAFTQQIKREVLAEVEKNISMGVKYPVLAAAKKFSIDARSVRKWNKDPRLREFIPANTANNLKRQKIGAGRKLEHPDLDEFVEQFVRERRQLGYAVNGFIVASQLKHQFPLIFADKTVDQVRQNVYRIFERL